MKIIEVVPYDPKWPGIYEEEASKIKSAFGANLIEIHHIGSTSVPGLAAKPVIDIIALVSDFKFAIPLLESIDFQYRGEMHLPFRAYFRKGKAVNLHLYEKSSPELLLNLSFRNYLRSHLGSLNEYAALKMRLVQDDVSFIKNNANYTGYNLGKDAFIRDILNKAGFDQIRLMYPNHHNEWEQYHRIRKEQLFEPTSITYDPNHPTITDPKCFHFVLYKGIEILSVAMIEFLDSETAALRTVATDEPYQHKGFGTQMIELLEKWMREKGVKTVKTHAALKAELFYRKLGYSEMEFDDKSITLDVIDLGKEL